MDEVEPGLYRRCNLCGFTVRSSEPGIVEWGIRDHVYREHAARPR